MGKYHITHDYDSLLDELLKVEERLAYISENGIAVGIVASEVANINPKGMAP